MVFNGFKEKTRVLLVDDDSALLKSTKEILESKYNYDIETATSANLALNVLSKKKFDIILCDIQMPEKDGFKFLTELRMSGNSIPFIVFTVTDNKETVVKALQLGANFLVGKYGDPEVVFSTLKKCIDEAIKSSKNRA